MISYWEQQSFTQYDYIIIGAGITGLSAAISVLEKEPASEVLVLERGLFSTGASTRNAGFACFGSLTELLSDIEQIGESATVRLVEKRWSGLQKLRKRLGDSAIDFHQWGGYELIDESNEQKLVQLDYVNELLGPVFGESVFSLEQNKIREFGFSSEKVLNLVLNKFEGQIDTGKMMKALLRKATHSGATILTNAKVDCLEEGRLSVRNMATGDDILFQAKQIGVCTNAFTSQFFPDIELRPGRGLALVTQPIKELPFKGTFHIDEGFFYFRNIHDRIILGGGRNLDFEAETTTKFELNQKILAALQNKLSYTIMPGRDVQIDQTWAGIMAFGDSKEPIVKRVDEQTVAGVRLGGMGVAIGSHVGEEIAELLVS